MNPERSIGRLTCLARLIASQETNLSEQERVKSYAGLRVSRSGGKSFKGMKDSMRDPLIRGTVRLV